MAIFYVGGCVDRSSCCDAATLPETIALDRRARAFTGQAAVGGFLGAGVREAMRYGVARGLFSNESGLGSAPIVAAAAQTSNPGAPGARLLDRARSGTPSSSAP